MKKSIEQEPIEATTPFNSGITEPLENVVKKKRGRRSKAEIEAEKAEANKPSDEVIKLEKQAINAILSVIQTAANLKVQPKIEDAEIEYLTDATIPMLDKYFPDAIGKMVEVNFCIAILSVALPRVLFLINKKEENENEKPLLSDVRQEA